MLYVGIDVAKAKHDCCIMDSDGVVHCPNYTFSNSRQGFNDFIALVKKCNGNNLNNVKVGLESTGHYSHNLIAFLKQSKLYVTVFNPLQVDLYHKAVTLRKTKTDKCDAKFICEMLFSDRNKSYQEQSYQISELKSLSRHRFRLVGYRSKLKISVTRIFDLVFPELSSVVWSVNQNSVYALALELPNTKAISQCNITRLTNLLIKTSYGKYRKEKALEIKQLATSSIGSNSPSLAFELQQTIRLVQNVSSEIELLEQQIKSLMLEIDSPVMTIPGISFVLGAIIISEIGDISNFENPSKLLAFAGCEPSTYQSGKYLANITPMVKRGSKYLRYALLTATRLVSIKCPVIKNFLNLKVSQGKHYFVALSHAARKLVRIIFKLLNTNTAFIAC
mgnify:CR=1 FL=1